MKTETYNQATHDVLDALAKHFPEDTPEHDREAINILTVVLAGVIAVTGRDNRTFREVFNINDAEEPTNG